MMAGHDDRLHLIATDLWADYQNVEEAVEASAEIWIDEGATPQLLAYAFMNVAADILRAAYTAQDADE